MKRKMRKLMIRDLRIEGYKQDLDKLETMEQGGLAKSIINNYMKHSKNTFNKLIKVNP